MPKAALQFDCVLILGFATKSIRVPHTEDHDGQVLGWCRLLLLTLLNVEVI